MLHLRKAYAIFALSLGLSQLNGQICWTNINMNNIGGCFVNQNERQAQIFDRLPLALSDTIREDLKYLATATSGFHIRFQTNAPILYMEWGVRNELTMPHMTCVGIQGFDLYYHDSNTWRFVNAAFPASKNSHARLTLPSMGKTNYEYMLFFPLYDGISYLRFGCDSVFSILPPALESPKKELPIVYYGTSITQGACASRPGMSLTNILTRRFDREFINMGFSGNARLDEGIALWLGSQHAAMYILDFMPNVTADLIYGKLRTFIAGLRIQNPKVPIIILDQPPLPIELSDPQIAQEAQEKRLALREITQNIMNQDTCIYLYSTDKSLGDDGDSTVDGIHFTDLGFMRYADFITPIIFKHLEHEK